MKYIEFLGLPGSGKSALAETTVAHLRARQQHVFVKEEARKAIVQTIIRANPGMLWAFVRVAAHVLGYRMWNLLWEKHQVLFLMNFIHEHSELVQHIVQAANEVEPPALIPRTLFSNKHLIQWIFDTAILYQASFDCLESNAILLQEEGFCQQAYYLLFAFRENTSHTQLLERYLQNIPRPDLVVSIVTEADQCESRMQQRAKGVSSDILRFLPVSERIELLAQRLNIYEKIANYLEAQHVEVIRLDNNNYRVSQQMLEDKLSRF